ncbi:hypothetical protein MKX03_016381 [Papaver bracteatum]|nr:hypothetical protein MKX03_016381 [Papaver bracteatum]
MSNFIDSDRCLIFIILSFGILVHQLVEGKTISNAHGSITKTIESDNDEIIDCYDIHRQPAFNNPLFHNHMIQLKPSSYPKGIQPKEQGNLKLAQTWHKYGLCPEGTVPIRRYGKNYQPNLMLSSKHLPAQPSNDITNIYEYATMNPIGDNFQGAQATINIWKPLTEKPEEYSTSQIWISAGDGEEVIEAGWEVNKSLFGDDEPRIFVYWTADHYNSTGCYNIQCSGFVQTASKVSLGSSFGQISTFKSSQYDATFLIFKEQSTGNWWLQVQGVAVGYWPHFLFKQLSFKATTIDFGGQILNTQPNGRHTNTQMGSGHLPSEGDFGISSFFRQVKVSDGNYEAKIPKQVRVFKTKESCYDLKFDLADSNGIKFYYGGPGFSDTCQ